MTWGVPTEVIVDIDGTLADIEHREHWVRHKPKNWPAFFTAMKDDAVHLDIVWLVTLVRSTGVKILISTGRNEEDRAVTEDWLDNVAGLKGLYEKVYMRPSKDYRADNIIKREILDKMRADGYNPTMVFDDRQQVVDEYRSLGLRVLQVSAGNF